MKKDGRIEVRVEKEYELQLKQIASGLDIPLGQLIRKALESYIKKDYLLIVRNIERDKK